MTYMFTNTEQRYTNLEKKNEMVLDKKNSKIDIQLSYFTTRQRKDGTKFSESN